ncbi:MAG: hypothetical protein WAV51_02080 [Microgenomates group bacterium]
MGEIIQEPVGIETTLTQVKFIPSKMFWKQRTYQFLSCSMQYSRFEGDVLVHIFCMTTSEASMQIMLNTKTLRWMLQDIESI